MPVFKPKDSRFYRIQFDINGRTYVKSAKTTDKRIAEKMEAKWRAEIHSQKYLGERQEITLDKMFELHIAKPKAASTLANHVSFYNILKEEIDLNVNASAFDMSELDRFIQKRVNAGIKATTIRTQMLILSGAWNSFNKKVYNIPPLEYTHLKQPKDKTLYLKPEHELALVEFLETRKPIGGGVGDWQHEIHDVLVMLIDTGARYNEICLLEWEQIDLKRRKIELWRKKNEVESYINMTDRVFEVLSRRSKNKLHAKWVFTNWKRTSHRGFQTNYLNILLKKIGIPNTLHHIRHGFATKLLKAGMTLKALKELLGHKDIKTTMRYGHLEASDVSSQAVDILNRQAAERKTKTKAA